MFDVYGEFIETEQFNQQNVQQQTLTENRNNQNHQQTPMQQNKNQVQ